MRENLMSSSGTEPRRRALRTFLVGLCAVAVVLVVASFVATNERPLDAWVAIAVGVALTLTHASQFVATNRRDALGYGPSDPIVAAAAILAPDQLGAAAVVFAALLLPGLRLLGTLERLRTATPAKVVFNGAARVIALLAAQTVALRMPADVPALATGLLAGAVYFVVCTALAVAVVQVAAGRRPVSWSGLGFLSILATGGSLLGATVAVTLPSAGFGPIAILALGGALYLVSHWHVHRALRVDAHDRLLELAPMLVANDGSVDAAVLDLAKDLLRVRNAVFAPVPAAAGQLSVPIAAPEGGDEHLVVWGRLGDHQRFDREDRELLAGLARLAGPARQQRHLVDELRHSEDSRAAIVGALAHDLRSPLATAGTGLATARRFLGELSPEQLASVLESASRGVDRSLAILDDLLDLERAELDPALTAGADIAEVAQAIAAASGSEVRVEGGPAVPVRIDDRILARILDNLVSNALKHAPGSEIRVGWSVTGDEVTIRVEDDGAGIPPELRELITGAFQQGAGVTSGVGLGLYLARRFAELAGGRLEVGESSSGGASLRVVLPLGASSSNDLAAG